MIADYLDCSVDYLIGRSPAPSQDSTGTPVAHNSVTGDVSCSVVAQGSDTARVVVRPIPADSLSPEEGELVRVYQSLPVRERVWLMNRAYDMMDEAEGRKGSDGKR